MKSDYLLLLLCQECGKKHKEWVCPYCTKKKERVR